jgi:DNA/RNA-binding domain of Phe-tRNA-synthetase-like protein
MIIRVSRECRELGIFVAHTEVVGVVNGVSSFAGEMEKAEKEVGVAEALKLDPVVRAYRDFYWRLGIDPTKTRPSGEALRRRVSRGSRLPRINDVVDAGNIVSLKTLVPIGLYDISRMVGEPSIVLSGGGELFHPIGSKPEVLAPGVPIMRDQRGLVMHLYPHRDSLDTSVTEATSSVLVVAAGVPGVEPQLVLQAVQMVCDLLKRIGGEKTHEVELSQRDQTA